jgi:hypothetical protein
VGFGLRVARHVIPSFRVDDEGAGDRLIRNGLTADRHCAVADLCLGLERLELARIGFLGVVIRMLVERIPGARRCRVHRTRQHTGHQAGCILV